jgi:hypothetical protein
MITQRAFMNRLVAMGTPGLLGAGLSTAAAEPPPGTKPSWLIKTRVMFARA